MSRFLKLFNHAKLMEHNFNYFHYLKRWEVCLLFIFWKLETWQISKLYQINMFFEICSHQEGYYGLHLTRRRCILRIWWAITQSLTLVRITEHIKLAWCWRVLLRSWDLFIFIVATCSHEISFLYRWSTIVYFNFVLPFSITLLVCIWLFMFFRLKQNACFPFSWLICSACLIIHWFIYWH